MDAIGPEYRLDGAAEAETRPAAWELDDETGLILHKASRALFAVYPTIDAAGAPYDWAAIRARLVHMCDSRTPPKNLAILGAQAINAFLFLTDRPEFQADDEGDEIPF